MKALLSKYFSFEQHQTTLYQETLAGVTTFCTMVYILALNPMLLSSAGMDAGAVFTATALSAGLITILMGVYAKLPFGLAPGVGISVFFSYTIIQKMGYSWEVALTAVFLEGLLFFILTITNIREAIVQAIPSCLKHAMCAGIGLFITLIGFKNAGIVVPSEGTIISLGSITAPPQLLTMIGALIICIFVAKKIQGSLLLGICCITILGIPFGITNIASFDATKLFTIPDISPIAFSLQWQHIFSFDILIVMLTLFFVDFFDTIGTLLGVSEKAGMVSKNGSIRNGKKALITDSIGTMFGALLGTPTVTVYIESASGVAMGGKTGMVAVVTGILFLSALFFAPLFLLIPTEATSAILIVVGIFMISSVTRIEWDDITEAFPAFITMIIMPLAYSIADGIVLGIVSYVAIKLCTNKIKCLNKTIVVLAIIFVIKLLWT